MHHHHFAPVLPSKSQREEICKNDVLKKHLENGMPQSLLSFPWNVHSLLGCALVLCICCAISAKVINILPRWWFFGLSELYTGSWLTKNPKVVSGRYQTQTTCFFCIHLFAEYENILWFVVWLCAVDDAFLREFVFFYGIIFQENIILLPFSLIHWFQFVRMIKLTRIAVPGSFAVRVSAPEIQAPWVHQRLRWLRRCA